MDICGSENVYPEVRVGRSFEILDLPVDGDVAEIPMRSSRVVCAVRSALTRSRKLELGDEYHLLGNAGVDEDIGFAGPSTNQTPL